MTTVFTIGYEGATQGEVIAALQVAYVARLIDVRVVPLSRRPGFSKNILAAGLRDAGIAYTHLKALGTPAAGREAARKGRHAEMARIYAGQLGLSEALAQGAELRALVAAGPCALLCFEREAAHCHRALLADVLLPDATRVDLLPGDAA